MSGPLNSSKPPTSEVVGAVYNVTPPTPSDGQPVALQTDSAGNLKVNVIAGGTGGGNVNIAQIGGVNESIANPLPVELSDGTNPFGTSINPINVNATPIAVTASGTITALNGTVTINVGGYGSVGIQITGTWSATALFEASVDGVNFQTIEVWPSNSSTSTTSSTGNGVWNAPVGGFNQVRVRASSFTSGTLTVSLRASHASPKMLAAGGTGGTSSSFGSAFPGVGTAVGLIANASAPTYTEGDMQAFSSDLSGLLRVRCDSNALKVDGSAVTQPVSGTVTANQGSPPWSQRIQDGTSSTLATVTASNALKVDGSAVTQPVSGTVTANAGTGTFTVGGTVTANQGSPPWSQRIQDGTSSTLATVTASNALKVDGSAVTQPVSGTVTANAGTGTFTVGGTVTANQGSPPWSQRIQDGASSTLATVTSSNALKVDGSAVTQPVSGTVTANQGSPPWSQRIQDGTSSTLATVTASNALKVDGSAVTQPVSGTVTANAGTGTFTVGGTVTANQGSPPWSQRIQDGASSTLATVTASNALKVDGSAVTQPVSGTVTANAGTGTFTVGGTVTANQGSPPWSQRIQDGTSSSLAAVSNSSSAGGTAQGLVVRNIPIKQQFASPITTTALGVSGVFNSAWQDTQAEATTFVEASARADVASAANGFVIQENDDTSQDANFTRTVASASVSANTTAFISANIKARFWRIQYTNGGTAQTSFKLEATASSQPPVNVNSTGTLLVDGSSVTQPVSGTVTANAGTGTFTVGGTVTANQGSPPWSQRIQDGTSSTLATVTASNALKVDGSAVTQPVSGTVTANAGTGTFTVGGTVTANQGSPPWSQRIQDGTSSTLATVTASNALKVDGSAVTQPVSGTVTANAGTGTFTVGGTVNIPSTNSAVTSWGQGATAAAVPSGAQQIGGRASSTIPTAVTDGQLVGLMADILGKLVVRVGASRQLIVQNTITLTTTTETTLLTAGSAGVFLDLTMLIISNTSATAVRVDIRDATAGTVRMSLYAPAGQTIGFTHPVTFTQTTAANNWTAQLSAAVTDVRIVAQAIQTV
jgi:hypothetical protein